MDWLTLRLPGDSTVPSDIPFRSEYNYERLRFYAERLNSDVIAIEEVESQDALRKVFNPAIYHFFLSKDPITQRVGLVVRKHIAVTVNPEITALNVAPPGAKHALRSGLDVTLHGHNWALRLLIVHLKTGCWARPLSDLKHSCPLLVKQIIIIKNWIINRESEGVPYALLGDFNRRLTLKDPAFLSWRENAPLTLVTAGLASPCRGGSRFLDHILLGSTARDWLIPDSLRVMTYRFDQDTSMISDHCPVSITLTPPQASLP